MLLTDARRPARTTADGRVVPLAEQDRGRWDRARIAEGADLLAAAIARRSVGEYQLQAAIAALHDRAPTAEATDWPQILALYGLLEQMTGNPVVTLNRAVATAMVHGPARGLAVLESARGRAEGLPPRRRGPRPPPGTVRRPRGGGRPLRGRRRPRDQPPGTRPPHAEGGGAPLRHPVTRKPDSA